MAEKLYDFALTTLDRVKQRMGITSTDNDAVLQRLINAVTDFVEGECQRRFKQATYADEVHSIWGNNLTFLCVNQMPIVSVAKLEYRAGTPGTPNWTQLGADFWEIVEDGASGMIRLYPGFAPMLYTQTNALRATYTAGYLIDFDNFGDPSKHNLPADLSDFSERLIVRWWKRRESGGKQSESLQNSSITWKDLLDGEDVDTLARYTKPQEFI